MNDKLEWDAFISHASEDKDSLVRPLAVALQSLGATIWYDEFSLRLGDSLSKSIDQGLARSRYAVVVLSQAFIRKAWPDYELRGLIAREIAGSRVLLPLWHGVTLDDLLRFSPTLADKLALNTEGRSAEDVAITLLREIRPDLYDQHPRAELARLADGTALRGLQDELERVREDLEYTKEQLGDYRCPFCEAPISSTGQAPVDDEQRDWDTYTSFECGHETFGGTHPIAMSIGPTISGARRLRAAVPRVRRSNSCPMDLLPVTKDEDGQAVAPYGRRGQHSRGG